MTSMLFYIYFTLNSGIFWHQLLYEKNEFAIKYTNLMLKFPAATPLNFCFQQRGSPSFSSQELI